MTRELLNTEQLRTVELIEAIGFGVIKRLKILGGVPCYHPEPRIIQTIKLGSWRHQRSDSSDQSFSLKKEFESLFDQLCQLGDGLVDVEVQHGLPFKIVREVPYKELLP